MNRIEPLDVVVFAAIVIFLALLSLRFASKDARVYGAILIFIGTLSLLGGIAWRGAAYDAGWETSIFVRPWSLFNDMAAVVAGALSVVLSLLRRGT